MRRFVLGTAGHVDHGKTTLVRALTGRDTDRLPEEKRRGITIELGFAPWDLGGGLQASVVDVPGHRKLVHAMIAGASGMELVMLVVAADEGVMPQTREHVAVCELLGVRRAVVVVTKTDAVDRELAGIAADEARALLGEAWSVADVVRVSAKTGEGLDALTRAVRKALDGAAPRTDAARARMGIDRVFTVKGAGTIVTGTLIEGRVKAGAPLFVVGTRGARATHARSLQVHDAAVDVAEAPTRLAVNLAGVALDEVKRGDVLTDDEALRATDVIDVELPEAAPLARGAAATLYVGTARAPVRALRVEERVARLRLAAPIAIAGGDRYVLRGSDVEGPAGAVIAGGAVLDASPAPVRSRTRWKAVIGALHARDADATARALVDERAPRPLERAALAGRFAIPAAAIARAADRLSDRGALVHLGERAWIANEVLASLVVRARELVEAHARAAPLDRGMPLETLREKLARAAGRDAAERAIKLAQRDARAPIAIEGDVARVGTSALDAENARRLAAARAAIEKSAEHGLGAFGVGEATGAPEKETRAVLARLERDGAVVHVGDLWFARAVLDAMRARAVDHFARARTLTVIEFKALTGLARKQAILFLELFDREGLTRREGEARVLVHAERSTR